MIGWVLRTVMWAMQPLPHVIVLVPGIRRNATSRITPNNAAAMPITMNSVVLSLLESSSLGVGDSSVISGTGGGGR